MLNFTHKKALAVAVVMLTSVAVNSYATPICTSSLTTNCCGNGVIETAAGETCDMGASGTPVSAANTYNKNSTTEPLSGCKSDCTIAAADTTGAWACSDAASYSNKLDRLKALFLRLANWQKGIESDPNTGLAATPAVAIAATYAGIGKDPKADCYYYDSALKPYPRAAKWTQSGYNCGQYQKDMLEFITLNYNTQSGTLDCVKARTIMGITSSTPIEFVNPLPTSIVPANVLNSSTYAYPVKGC